MSPECKIFRIFFNFMDKELGAEIAPFSAKKSGFEPIT